MYFPSKKDSWLTILVWITIVICILPPIVEKEMIAMLITGPVALFMIWLWMTTGYTIKKEVLLIKAGPIRKTIRIQEITTITKTKNPLSSPALSLDRIKISYGGSYGFILISPLERQEFLKELLKQNPAIELDPKLID